MRSLLLSACLLLFTTTLHAQKVEEGFDYAFKPTQGWPRYYVITEKKDSLYHRQAYYLPEKGLAMEGWYKDAACKMPHGAETWYHVNRVLKSKVEYVNGQRQGQSVSYFDDGSMQDSGYYIGGKLKGIKLGWNREGVQVDSMHFDGAGNGTQVSWFSDGALEAAGYWVADTLKKGRWKYYHSNGQVKAVEEFAANGKRTAVACYNEEGQPLAQCDEKEADFAGGNGAWSKYLGRKLRSDVPVKMGAPEGQYTVVVQFIVNHDGSIEKAEPKTKFGFGMEEEGVRIISQSPRWEPARQFGKTVKAYRLQPITFMVSKG